MSNENQAQKSGDKDVVKPLDSTRPIQPMDSTRPIQPMDSTRPIQPMDSTRPIQPMDSTRPIIDSALTPEDSTRPGPGQGAVKVKDTTQPIAEPKQ
ncbi:laminin G [Streptomyces piniterrae]|uniref:Laminin G n=1 Tax=Streptomyces piniterrae TaxID=2571125 RepID=A0A4U0NDF8_9ACTN|nr:laminin G [Streptomyces piniterrae]TJZ52077.1 laminin G [Streptomyces piniterrae]